MEERATRMSMPRPEAIIVLGGSFSPIHSGHIAAIEAGKQEAEQNGYDVVAGYLVCAEDRWLQNKLIQRGENGSQPLSLCEAARLRMCNEVSADTDWLQPTTHAMYSAKKYGERMVTERHRRDTKVICVKGSGLPSLSRNVFGKEISSTYIRQELYAGGAARIQNLVNEGSLPPAAGRVLTELLAKGSARTASINLVADSELAEIPSGGRTLEMDGKQQGETGLVSAQPFAEGDGEVPVTAATATSPEKQLNHPEVGVTQCPHAHVFQGEWDNSGVYVYQAYSAAIADWAVANQSLGGPHFKPDRMTWIKPSFAWVLYRSGYARKHCQERILKIKLSHHAVALLLSECACKHGGGGTKGRVQWDPARDLLSAEDKGRAPRRMLRERAIQIGLSKELSHRFVASILEIHDVTDLAHRVSEAHGAKDVQAAMADLAQELPMERPYIPQCSTSDLVRLGMAV
mmetsp:Transcript_46675/g.122578  ORF Transcript_46675/g.122578 Transcript_46675/m.122578 type:complete len:459 (+) Transcript_46675:126-1502(+)|eukprot:CAMPEP_0115851666 /NCGR_PEP_ID=MMETSP0287-20121206/12599_1 /TAXON_ID=412157 /ORGANISM="Chrysochromulina rotalis, Strain UIO044" /LENGTH=458 /DNA_ID=CAMNT_0003305705 /DNA_START=113 /DNA_END=1489 /DNA_ORIENTATION=+